MPASSQKKPNTITKANIAATHAMLFKKTQQPVPTSAIFGALMDYPHLAHARHTERFSRLMVACVRKGMINPLELDKPVLN